jgi:hypothetical protein
VPCKALIPVHEDRAGSPGGYHLAANPLIGKASSSGLSLGHCGSL